MPSKATWRSPALGERKVLDLPGGKQLAYFEAGSGAPIVFVHGLLVNANLWRKVVERLLADFRCIALDLPLGSHTLPMPEGADLAPPAVANLVADAIEALGLEDVTLVGNDSGGALAQMLVTTPARADRPARADLVRLPRQLPAADVRLLQAGRPDPGRVAGAVRADAVPLRPLPADRLRVAGEAPDRSRRRGLLHLPGRCDPGVGRDTKEFIRGIDKRRHSTAADKLGEFDKPALIAWSREDKLFSPRTPSRWPRICRTRGSSGSRTPTRSRWRTTRRSWPRRSRASSGAGRGSRMNANGQEEFVERPPAAGRAATTRSPSRWMGTWPRTCPHPAMAPPARGSPGSTASTSGCSGDPGPHGEVHRWEPTDDGMTIEIRPRNAGGAPIELPNRDRIVLRDGLLAERHADFRPLGVLPGFGSRPAMAPCRPGRGPDRARRHEQSLSPATAKAFGASDAATPELDYVTRVFGAQAFTPLGTGYLLSQG